MFIRGPELAVRMKVGAKEESEQSACQSRKAKAD